MIKSYLPEILEHFPLFPEQASTVAGEVDLLTFVWTTISLISTVVIVTVMVVFLVRYRRKHPAQTGGKETHAPMVEVISMVIPFIVVMAMFVWGAKVFIDLERVPEDAVEYYVFGKQWMWKFQHPNGLREINNFTVPVDTPIKMTMTSEDVIHSFFVPAFRVKQDVLPGRYTTVWFEATKTGEYRQMCAEYCGSEHSLMGGVVTVLEQDEYQAWLNGETLYGSSPVSSGEELFTSLSCATCHEAENTDRGPSLRGVYGSEVQLASGALVRADEVYLRESIVDPRAKLVAGYVPLMPTFEGQITEEQLFDLVSYIKSLATDGAVADASSDVEPDAGHSAAAGGN